MKSWGPTSAYWLGSDQGRRKAGGGSGRKLREKLIHRVCQGLLDTSQLEVMAVVPSRKMRERRKRTSGESTIAPTNPKFGEKTNGRKARGMCSWGAC